MQRRRVSLAWMVAAIGCSRAEPEAPPKIESTVEVIPVEDEPSPYPLVDPARVTALEVLYFSEAVGPGYARRPVRIGQTLHSGKYLGLANGQAEFFGPRHILVDHLRSRPSNPYMGDIEKTVLLDVETGEVVVELGRYGRPIRWSQGLAIVYPLGDSRPHLLDAEHGDLVLAMPEGEHDYVYGENYWIEPSWADRRIWITARDPAGVVHLYEWENRRAPPELPNNPFLYVPDDWDSGGDSDEVRSRTAYECERAILIPPRRWECLEGRLAETLPLSDGWRLDHRGVVFNHRDGRGFDFASLCPAEHPVTVRVLDRLPAQVQIGCEGDRSVWMVWMAPDRVQRLDPELAVRVNAAELLPVYYEDLGHFKLSDPFPPDFHVKFDSKDIVVDLIGKDFACPDLEYLPGPRSLSGVACRRSGGPRIWFELVDVERNLRSRFKAIDLAVGPTGNAVAIIRRNGRDQIAPIGIQ